MSVIARGLISRAALTQEREDNFVAGETALRLVSVSTPYAGIAAADHCASVTARLLSLGLVIPVCRLISGEKWYEITSASPFVQHPGELLEEVSTHLKIVTNESGSCRNYDKKGVCVEDDFVFSTKEQYLAQIDASPRVENVEVAAGHVEIVGNYNVTPVKLIEVMQAKGIMFSTPERRENFRSYCHSSISIEPSSQKERLYPLFCKGSIKLLVRFLFQPGCGRFFGAIERFVGSADRFIENKIGSKRRNAQTDGDMDFTAVVGKGFRLFFAWTRNFF